MRNGLQIAGVSGRLAACAALVAACTGRSESLAAARAEAPAILFTVDLWPGEGVPVIETRRQRLLLRAMPDPDAPVIDTLRGAIGRRLSFDSTRFQTVRAGTLRVLDSIRLTGREIGTDNHVTRDQYYLQPLREVAIPVVAPSTVEYLQDRAEGTCFIRVDGKVIDANPCPAFTTDHVRVEREPITRWWIRVRGQGGASGWILVSDSTAQSTRREF